MTQSETHRPIAVIDMGTNSFKYMLGRRIEGKIQILLDGNLTVRLGKMLEETGAMGAQAQMRGSEALSKILELLQPHQPDKIICVGSMTLRKASDAARFIQIIEERFGLQVKILSGEEEAGLAWQAATYQQNIDGYLAVLDIGGGSAELILGKQEIQEKHSLPLGAVSLTRRFLHHDPPTEIELESLKEYADGILQSTDAGKAEPISRLIVIGGSAINLAAMQYHLLAREQRDFKAWLEDSVIGIHELQHLISLLCGQPLETRKQIPGLERMRADIIIAGAVVLYQSLIHLHLKEFQPIMRGIRHGVLFSALSS